LQSQEKSHDTASDTTNSPAMTTLDTHRASFFESQLLGKGAILP